MPGINLLFNVGFWSMKYLLKSISLVTKAIFPFQAEGHKLYKDLKNFLSAVKGGYSAQKIMGAFMKRLGVDKTTRLCFLPLILGT